MNAPPRHGPDGSRLVYSLVSRERWGPDISVAVVAPSGADETPLATATGQARATPRLVAGRTRRFWPSWWPPRARTVLTLWPVAAAPHADAAALLVAEDPEDDLCQARFSPNGRWIGFLAIPPGRAIICVIPNVAHTVRATDGPA